MKQLIVNADDFGLTEGVSKGIVDAFLKGIVSSTTLMANGAAFESAVSMSQCTPDLGIGVHLNLTTGKPVSSARSIPSLVGREGRFYLTASGLLRSLASRQVNPREIEAELREQITKVLKAGIRPTHLDGHKHVHVMPGVAEIVIRLAQEFSIRSVRSPQELRPKLASLLCGASSRTAVLKQYLVGRAVTGFARSFTKQLTKAGLLYAEHFYGLSQTGFLNVPGVLEILESLPEGISELMCHPGYLDADLANSGTRLLAQREVEIQALTAHAVKKAVANNGIQLVSYGQCVHAREPVPAVETVSIGSECGLNTRRLSDE
jgi:chitin disaccharide deacetylase